MIRNRAIRCDLYMLHNVVSVIANYRCVRLNTDHRTAGLNLRFLSPGLSQ